MAKNNGVCLLAFLLGGGVFIAVYGIYVLNPQNVRWLIYEGEDLAQHYLGWVGYRNSDWFFPARNDEPAVLSIKNQHYIYRFHSASCCGF